MAHRVPSWGDDDTLHCLALLPHAKTEGLLCGFGSALRATPASKAGKICNSSSGQSHCPDRGSEMIVKSSKRCSLLPSDLSSFSEELQAQKSIVSQSLLNTSSACLGLCPTQVQAGEVWPCSFLLPRQLLAPLLPLAFFFDSRSEFEFQTITRGILCIHLLF